MIGIPPIKPFKLDGMQSINDSLPEMKWCGESFISAYANKKVYALVTLFTYI